MICWCVIAHACERASAGDAAGACALPCLARHEAAAGRPRGVLHGSTSCNSQQACCTTRSYRSASVIGTTAARFWPACDRGKKRCCRAAGLHQMAGLPFAAQRRSIVHGRRPLSRGLGDRHSSGSRCKAASGWTGAGSLASERQRRHRAGWDALGHTAANGLSSCAGIRSVRAGGRSCASAIAAGARAEL
jgi:hypothetical protein